MRTFSCSPFGRASWTGRFPVLLATALLLTVLPGRASAQDFASLVDPALAERVRAAVQRSNPGLAARKAAIEAARAGARAAGFSPPVVLSGEVEEVPGFDLTGGSMRFELAREFLTPGRRSAARALASSEVGAASAALHAMEQVILARTDRTLARHLGWSLVARRLAAEDSLLRAAEESLRGRFAVGEARYTDVLRLRTERLRVQTERAAALTQAHVSRQTLASLAGLDPGSPEFTMLLASAEPSSAIRVKAAELPPAPDVDSLLALSGRLRLARAALARTEAAREVVLAEQSPHIAAAVGAQVMNDGGDRTVGPTLGVSISLPFTAGRANQAAAHAAERAVAAAQAEVDAARNRVRSALLSARARYEAVREQLGVYDAALLRGAREEREGALAAYRSGELSLIELLDFERALAHAETQRLHAYMDAADAYADLLSAANEGGAADHEDSILQR